MIYIIYIYILTAPLVPEYARETRSSCKRRELREEAGNQSPWNPDEILDHPVFTNKDQQDIEVMSYISEDELQNEEQLPVVSFRGSERKWVGYSWFVRVFNFHFSILMP